MKAEELKINEAYVYNFAKLKCQYMEGDYDYDGRASFWLAVEDVDKIINLDLDENLFGLCMKYVGGGIFQEKLTGLLFRGMQKVGEHKFKPLYGIDDEDVFSDAYFGGGTADIVKIQKLYDLKEPILAIDLNELSVLKNKKNIGFSDKNKLSRFNQGLSEILKEVYVKSCEYVKSCDDKVKNWLCNMAEVDDYIYDCQNKQKELTLY